MGDRGAGECAAKAGSVICRANTAKSQALGCFLRIGKLPPRRCRWGIVAGWQTPAQLRNLATPDRSSAEITMTHIQQVHDVVARTLWGEARGEGIRGQIAVAWVIRNRVQDAQPRSWWGEGYIGVCRKPWQFSCWNLRDPNYPFVSGARPIPPAQLAQALAVAEQVVAGQVADPTGGATHYHATHLSPPPAWTKDATRTVVLGGHAFFKNVA